MTEHTGDTPTELPEGDTPGPEATPAQDAAVTSLLGLLRADDLPMPDDVVRRLDAVLAEERRSALEAGGLARIGLTGLAPAAGTDDLEDDPSSGPAATVTVLPTDRAARHATRGGGPTFGMLKVLGGVAAAVVIVYGGATVLFHHDGSSASTSAASAVPSAAAAEGSSAAYSPEAVMRSTGTKYSKAALSSQVSALISLVRDAKAVGTADSAGTGAQATAPSVQASPSASSALAPTAASAPVPSATSSGTDGRLQTTGGYASGATPSGTALDTRALSLTAGTLDTCVVALTGREGVVPLAVDHGTWEGSPADILVLPSADDPSTVEVYVIAPGCTSEATVQIREVAFLPAP